jgi:hypothetical protein
MLNLIPLPYRVVIIGVLLLSASIFCYVKGYDAASTSYKLKIANLMGGFENQVLSLKNINADISNKVVVKYVDKINTIHEKEIQYVNVAEKIVPSQFELSNGWVYLHDVSATNDDADTTRSSDATPSGIKDNEALTTIVNNYATCTQNANQLTALQNWISENKAAVDKLNAKKPETKGAF